MRDYKIVYLHIVVIIETLHYLISFYTIVLYIPFWSKSLSLVQCSLNFGWRMVAAIIFSSLRMELNLLLIPDSKASTNGSKPVVELLLSSSFSFRSDIVGAR